MNRRRIAGFFMVWWRIRKNMVRDFQTMRPSPWWSMKAVYWTFVLWHRMGYGKDYRN